MSMALHRGLVHDHLLPMCNVYVEIKIFIVPTDAHCYKIIEMLKQFKIIILHAGTIIREQSCA
jgi:hypothetical protein